MVGSNVADKKVKYSVRLLVLLIKPSIIDKSLPFHNCASWISVLEKILTCVAQQIFFSESARKLNVDMNTIYDLISQFDRNELQQAY